MAIESQPQSHTSAYIFFLSNLAILCGLSYSEALTTWEINSKGGSTAKPRAASIAIKLDEHSQNTAVNGAQLHGAIKQAITLLQVKSTYSISTQV